DCFLAVEPTAALVGRFAMVGRRVHRGILARHRLALIGKRRLGIMQHDFVCPLLSSCSLWSTSFRAPRSYAEGSTTGSSGTAVWGAGAGRDLKFQYLGGPSVSDTSLPLRKTAYIGSSNEFLLAKSCAPLLGPLS